MLKGNLPGEPPLESVPDIKVTRCGDCPFNSDLGCWLDEHGRGWWEENPSLDPYPPWCPLDKGPALVQLRRG